MTTTEPPALTVLSLGAGVALLAVEGTLPKPDAAIFADTGWEPRNVYEHLGQLEAQTDIFDQLHALDLEVIERREEEGDPDGCGPYGCRSGEPVGGDE